MATTAMMIEALVEMRRDPSTATFEHFWILVERFRADNLLALNFLLHDSLGGGGSESLKTDAQGKTHGLGILYLELDVPDDLPLPN